LTLFSRSRVACRRARRPEVEGCVALFFLSSSEENMTLYRSISVVGISTASNGLSDLEFSFGVMAVHSSSTRVFIGESTGTLSLFSNRLVSLGGVLTAGPSTGAVADRANFGFAVCGRLSDFVLPHPRSFSIAAGGSGKCSQSGSGSDPCAGSGSS
jgi:hypothetical protein